MAMRSNARRQQTLPGLDAPFDARLEASALQSTNPPAGPRTGPANAGASLYDRGVTSWRPGLRSADADTLFDKATLTARARDLVRNNGIAKGGIQTVVDNVVGVGLRLNPRPNYVALKKTKEWADEWSRLVRAEWYGWAETTACDAADTMIFDQLTGQMLRTQLNAGDATALPLWIPNRGDGWATKIQTIDPDRLSTPNGRTENSKLRSGIQYDDYGAPIGYWFRRSHPGEYLQMADPSDAYTWEFVPKYTSFGRRRAIHCYDKERSGQSRGIPVLSSVLSNFKGLDRYTSAEIQAAVVNAMVAFTIETPLDQEGIEALFKDNAEGYLDARRDHAVSVDGATMVPLFPGDKLNSFAPNRPASGFGAFQSNVSRIIALALDMPGELLMKDFTQANYSSMRAAMLEAWRSFNRRRDDLGTQWADPVYALWLEEAINAGKIEAPDFYENRYAYTRCKWIGPGRGWVDPGKEADAALTRIMSGVSTLEKECAEQGEDWRDVLEQRAVELEYMKKLNIPPPQMPGRGSNTPPADDPADDSNAPPPKPKQPTPGNTTEKDLAE